MSNEKKSLNPVPDACATAYASDTRAQLSEPRLSANASMPFECASWISASHVSCVYDCVVGQHSVD
jgi:hypothetical protein